MDLTNHQQKLEDVEQRYRDIFDKNDLRMREMEESIYKQAEKIDNLNAWLDKALVENEGTVKSLNTDFHTAW